MGFWNSGAWPGGYCFTGVVEGSRSIPRDDPAIRPGKNQLRHCADRFSSRSTACPSPVLAIGSVDWLFAFLFLATYFTARPTPGCQMNRLSFDCSISFIIDSLSINHNYNHGKARPASVARSFSLRILVVAKTRTRRLKPAPHERIQWTYPSCTFFSPSRRSRAFPRAAQKTLSHATGGEHRHSQA